MNMDQLVILAGGKSSRMGEDKTFLEYHGESFLTHLIRAGSEIFDEILVSAGSKEHADRIREHLLREGSDPVRIIPDLYESAGPMGGLLSVFEQTGAEAFAVIAVDSPLAELRVCSALLDTLQAADPDDGPAAVMLTLDGEHPEACAAAYSHRAQERMRSAYREGQFSICKALGRDHMQMIRPEALAQACPQLSGTDFQRSFHNFNTKEDLQQL